MQRKIRLPYTRRLIVISLIVFGNIFTLVTSSESQDFSAYHTYEEMTDLLKETIQADKNIARMESIGTTLEGRDIWLVEIANPEGVPVEQRPALFIGANFEGDHLIGSEIALSCVDFLINNYSSREDVKERIDNHVFYIIPRVNPDAAENMFAEVKTGRKTNTKPYDDDNDGRIDEDGPEDLNEDGNITVMRVSDSAGIYCIDPDEPLLMKKADPTNGETGIYKLYWEGVDSDMDGFINEDSPGGTDINRNFQHEYPYYETDAGRHMVSEEESRAVMDWILAHRNIAAILTFGESDNLISPPDNRGKMGSARLIDLFSFADESNESVGTIGVFRIPGTGRIPGSFTGQQNEAGRQNTRRAATNVDSTDVDYFRMISDKYRELTNITEQPPVRKPEGAFFQYGYFQFGVPSFSTPGWGMTTPEPDSLNGTENNARKPQEKQPPNIDSLVLSWMDREGIDGFVNWSEYDHPDLGKVEIGGFIPYATTNPPSEKITGLGDSHAEFILHLSSLFAQVHIAHTEIINHGGGIFRIKAEIENTGFLPTSLAQGITSRSVKPTMVQLDIDPEALISGDPKTSFFPSLDGSGKRNEYEWLIKGETGEKIELTVVSQKGGTDTVSIVLE